MALGHVTSEKEDTVFRMEFHAAEGGADAEMFAAELASSVSRFASLSIERSGRLITATSDHRL